MKSLDGLVPPNDVLADALTAPSEVLVLLEEPGHALALGDRGLRDDLVLQATDEILDAQAVDRGVVDLSGSIRGNGNVASGLTRSRRDRRRCGVHRGVWEEVLVRHGQTHLPGGAAQATDKTRSHRAVHVEVLAQLVDAHLVLPVLEPRGVAVPARDPRLVVIAVVGHGESLPIVAQRGRRESQLRYHCEGRITLCINDGVADSLQRSCYAS